MIKKVGPSFCSIDGGAFTAVLKAGKSFSLILWMPLLLTFAPVFNACPAPVNILNAQYTTGLYEGGASPHSRGNTSPTPVDDSFCYSSETIAMNTNINPSLASASAGFLGTSVYTGAVPLPPDNDINHADAFAGCDLWFSPLTSQTASLTIQMTVNFGFNFTWGNVSLLDVTTGDVLWNYGWNGNGAGFSGGPGSLPEINNNDATPVPWDASSTFGSGGATATLLLDSALNASDTYKLSMKSASDSATDFEQLSIQASGLESVPEPSSIALMGLGLLALIVGRRQASKTHPVAQQNGP